MPMTYAKERAIISRVLLGIVVNIYRVRAHRKPNRINAGDADLLLVGAVVFLGTVERRPKTAAGVARALMMPRPTVVRKLEQLIRGGVAELRGGRYYTVDRDGIDFSYVDVVMDIIRREGRR
jgi:hypothetical protein